MVQPCMRADCKSRPDVAAASEMVTRSRRSRRSDADLDERPVRSRAGALSFFKDFSSLACPFEAFEPRAGLRRSKSLSRRAPRPAAGPPTRAIAGARARAVTMATMRPPKHLNSRGQRLMFTEMEDQPRAARRAEDEARVLFL